MNYFFILIILTVTCACNGIGTAEIDGIGAVSGTGTETDDSTIATFAGISSIDLKTDTTLRLNWTAHGDAVAYDVFNVTTGSSVWVAISSQTLVFNIFSIYKFH